MDAGTGASAGAVVVGGSSAAVTIGAAGRTTSAQGNVAVSGALSVGGSVSLGGDGVFVMRRASRSANGDAAATQIQGQSASARGGDLSLDAGTGATGGQVLLGTSSGGVVIGAPNASIVMQGRMSVVGDVSLDATTVSVGPSSGAATITRPVAGLASEGAALHVTGQQSTTVGGDVFVDGGAGATVGRVYVGSGSRAVVLGSPSAAITLAGHTEAASLSSAGSVSSQSLSRAL